MTNEASSWVKINARLKDEGPMPYRSLVLSPAGV